MKNFEKYKTAEERYSAFHEYCKEHPECFYAPYEAFNWLDFEAEEDGANPLPCPFCGGKCSVHGETYAGVECDEGCGYSARAFGKGMFAEAIAAHNNVCKAVMAYNKVAMYNKEARDGND